jgi:hypothetical protein
MDRLENFALQQVLVEENFDLFCSIDKSEL